MSDGSALQHDGLADGGSPSKSRTLKSVTVAAAGLIAATTLLAGCGEPKAAPMNDEYAGNSGETEKSQESESQSSSGSDSSSKRKSTTSDKKDTGNYADGDYSVNGQYGPVGEDTIDVHLTIKNQNVTAVSIVGHPFTSISKKHQNDFAKAVPDAVVGKPLKDLKVDKLAGASWTTEAFNKALDVARQEASVQ